MCMNIRVCVTQDEEEEEEKRTNAFPPSRQRYRDRAKKLQRESLYRHRLLIYPVRNEK